jgi:hypothetical protein
MTMADGGGWGSWVLCNLKGIYARFPGSSCTYQRERETGSSLTYWTGSFIIEDFVFKMNRVAHSSRFEIWSLPDDQQSHRSHITPTPKQQQVPV